MQGKLHPDANLAEGYAPSAGAVFFRYLINPLSRMEM